MGPVGPECFAGWPERNWFRFLSLFSGGVTIMNFPIDALRTVTDYLWKDEEKDYLPEI